MDPFKVYYYPMGLHVCCIQLKNVINLKRESNDLFSSKKMSFSDVVAGMLSIYIIFDFRIIIKIL